MLNDLAGKTAFVTGGASGIGLAMGRAFAEAGMRVMLADIEPKPLQQALEALQGNLPEVRGVLCDVRDYDAVERAAHMTVEAFGKVHVVCNNAGVSGAAGADNISLQDWRWVIDINLMGVVHGVKAFVPLLKTHGEGGHIVNTASMAGFLSGTGFGAYTASKFAVVGIRAARHWRQYSLPRLGCHLHQRKPPQLAPGIWRAAALGTALRAICRAHSQQDGAERCRGVGSEGN
jgi:NAD(P)-dependent dehydrogenase (short-subunit alcohol dehydrogenase family)